MAAQRTLGVNGIGGTGKLTLWHHLGRDDFDRFVVNTGRPVGASLDSVVQYLSKDSTYGALHRFLFGRSGTRDMSVADEETASSAPTVRRSSSCARRATPRRLPWRDHGVTLVVDATGTFRDPDAERTRRAAPCAATWRPAPPWSSRARRSRARTRGSRCRDAAILVHGINDYEFDPARHTLVSPRLHDDRAGALIRPLLDRDLTKDMITAGMSTIHAVTNSQPVLDSVPKAGATDLRKTRGAIGNLVLTSTNAAAALEQVMPEIGTIGFMGDSVRVPTQSVSLIILNVTFQSETLPDGSVSVERDAINAIYRDAADGEARGLLKYTDEQNVSVDMLGEDAAVVIEGAETHTRTGFMNLKVPPCEPSAGQTTPDVVRVPLHPRQGVRLVRQRDGQLHVPAGRADDQGRAQHVTRLEARPLLARLAAARERPAQAVVEGRPAQRRVGQLRQLREAQVGVLDAQLRDVAELRRQSYQLRRRHEPAEQHRLARAGRRRPARVRGVAVGEPVGALPHGAEHGVLLPAQTRIVSAEDRQQVGGRLAALGVAGHVALARGERERQLQAREQAPDLLGEVLVLHRELHVDRRAGRRYGPAADEQTAEERRRGSSAARRAAAGPSSGRRGRPRARRPR